MIRRPIGREMARTAVVVGTATAVSGRVAHRQQEKYMAEEQQQYPAAAEPQQQYAEAPAPAAAAAGGLSPEDLDTLKELASLKDQGVLTEAEFEAQKAKILGA